MYEDSDRLLFVLSGRGTMRWQSFKSSFDSLLRLTGGEQAAQQNFVPRWALLNCVRTLEGMGHCDFDFDQSQSVFVAPPLLARLPRAGQAVAVVTGARTPSLVERLRAAAKIIRVHVRVVPPPKDAVGIPSSIYVESPSEARIRKLSAGLGIRFPSEPPAWRFAQFAGSVNEYLESLDWLPTPAPDWSRFGYDPTALGFMGLHENDSCLRLSRHEVHGRWTYALWRNGKRATANLDWARHAVASELSQRLIAYDPGAQVFGVPFAAPVPKPVSRALGLCSGHSPTRSRSPRLAVDIIEKRRVFDLYEGVPRTIAELVAAKLGQGLRHANYRKGEFTDG